MQWEVAERWYSANQKSVSYLEGSPFTLIGFSLLLVSENSRYNYLEMQFPWLFCPEQRESLSQDALGTVQSLPNYPV